MVRKRREQNIVVQDKRKQAVPGGGARITSHSRVSPAVGQNKAERDLIRLLSASFIAWADSFSIPRHSALLCMRPPSLRWLLPDNLIEAAITILSLQVCDLLRLGLGEFYWLFLQAIV